MRLYSFGIFDCFFFSYPALFHAGNGERKTLERNGRGQRRENTNARRGFGHGKIQEIPPQVSAENGGSKRKVAITTILPI